MFDNWMDVTSGVAMAGAVAYTIYAIDQRQRKLKDMMNVLDGQDAALSRRLEELIQEGLLPYSGAAKA
ncbi:MAG: hypothetical protein ABSG51_15365 [Terracidiphilus sp.]|jgi:hypothetical protein